MARGVERQADYYATSADLPERTATVAPTDAELETLGLNKSGRSVRTGMLNPRGDDTPDFRNGPTLRGRAFFATDDQHYESVEEASGHLMEIYQDILFLAQSEKTYSVGAVLFYELPVSGQEAVFNDTIVPIYLEHNLPIPNQGKAAYDDFQQAVKRMWKDTPRPADWAEKAY